MAKNNFSNQAYVFCSFCKKEVLAAPGPKSPAGVVGLYCPTCGKRVLG